MDGENVLEIYLDIPSNSFSPSKTSSDIVIVGDFVRGARAIFDLLGGAEVILTGLAPDASKWSMSKSSSSLIFVALML
jgi:hypothetical protein